MATPSEADAAHLHLLAETEYRLRELYRTLGDLAGTLEPAEPTPTDTQEQIGYRTGLSGIYRHVQMARHELHGAITEVEIARALLVRLRRPPSP